MARETDPRANPSPVLASMRRAATFAALAVLAVGGLNLALIGIFDIDLVAAAFGSWSNGPRWMQLSVGAAGAYGLMSIVPFSSAGED